MPDPNDTTPPSARAPRRKPRVYCAAGPGSLIDSYKHWRDGVDLPREMSVTYSGQLFNACRELGVELVATASSPAYEKFEELRDGDFTIRQRPAPWEAWRGPIFQLGEIYGIVRHLLAIARAGADVAILQGGYLHWYLFSLLRLFGVRLVPVLMVVFWPKYKRPGLYRRTVWAINGRFFGRVASEILSASEDCADQAREITKGHPAPIRLFLPKYRPGLFLEIGDKPSRPPFRVLYVGRVEREKGVFDLLEVARRFAAEGKDDIEFDLCGTGSAIEPLRKAVEEAGLSARFRLLGHTNQQALREMFHKAHVSVVPTRTDFVEGFNQVVVESVISGTPVVTSGVCPSLATVADAAVEVPPDDVKAYGDAILRLRDDPGLYEQKRAACARERGKFFDDAQSFEAVVEASLRKILEDRGLIPRPLVVDSR